MTGRNLGIIGAGAFAKFCLAAYKKHLPELNMTGICDLDKTLAKAVAKEFNIPTVFDSVEQLLASDCDVVLILTPPNQHFDLAKQALGAGKHVLVEKPIAFSDEQAKELIELAESKKLKMTANLVLRYHPFHQKLFFAVSSGEFGQLRQIATTALLAKYPENSWYWDINVSGGFFLNTFCHFLDLYDYVAGQTATDAKSTGSLDNGYSIISQYADSLNASLSINLMASNDQEYVQTTYVFDRAIFQTNGWLPDQLITRPKTGQVGVEKSPEKLELYQQILAKIMGDLLKSIDDANFVGPITHQTLLEAVGRPLQAQANQF